VYNIFTQEVLMRISAGIANYTASIRSAIQMSLLSKATHQDAQSVDSLIKSVSQTTGKGQTLDIKV